MEKLDRRDRRFIALCLATIAAGALVTIPLFYRAFPEASIEFRVNREQARALAEKFLAGRGHDVSHHRFAGRFEIEDEPKVYLERELGLEKAGRYYGREAKVWRWQMRWFQSGVKEEEKVEITPLGDLAAFESVRRDDAAGPSPPEEEARNVSRQFLASRGLADNLKLIEAAPVVRPRREDWRFVDERGDLRMGEATVRYETIVSGGVVSSFREFVHVPESWQRDYRTLRSKNETANVVGNFLLIVTFLAMFGVLLTKIIRKDVRWGLVAIFGVVAFFLSLLSAVNGLPLALYDYDTASPLSAYFARLIVLGGLLGSVGVGAGIALVVAGAEPVYRERFPQHLSLSGMFSRRGLRSKRFFLGLLLGYALTAFFFAYQVVFYVVAARLGAWAPSDVKYDNMLSTAFPWATVLFIGFLPAVLEEGSSRLFSISFLDRLGVGKLVAIALPAFIWGFNHAAYPNQPFYIRGVEVGLAGCAMGVVLLRWGALPLLVWHFTVDALYTALILLRSGNAYYLTTGAISSLILLLPLALSLALYWKRGGFEPAAGLTNGEEGFVPAPPPSPLAPEEVPAVRALRRPVWVGTAAVALLLATGFLVPSRLSAPLVEDAVGRRSAEETARAFLKANGISLDGFRSVTYAGTGFADDEQVRALRPDEEGKIPGFAEADAAYIVRQGGIGSFERLARQQLPLAFWVTRFFRPLQKAEWKVLIDSRRGRVIGFVNPIEENAAAPPAPSEETARRRTLDAAARLGYPASYKVIEVGTRDRPRRKDTTVVLEASPPGIGDARPRLTAVFHGSVLSAFYPSIRVPESFLRGYQRQSLFEPVFLGAKIVAIGSFIGIAVVLFIRLVKSYGLGWKRLWPPIALVALLAAAALANSAATLLRAYPTDDPLALFVGTAITLLALLWLLILCAAGIGFVLLSGARPGWRRAMRTQGTLPDAFWRAAIAAVGIVGLQRISAVLSERIPDLFEASPMLPAALERSIPGFDVFARAVLFSFRTAVAAAVIALMVRGAFLRTSVGKGLAAVALLLVLLPTASHSPMEFFGNLILSLLTVAWLAVSAFLLLRDHAAAWVLFGALASGVPAAVKLLGQPVGADRVAGATAIVLLALAVIALLVGRRREPAAREPAVIEPQLAPDAERDAT